mmetsp:Transcript_65389/g.212834  ORF Transcript_65389/g.212834 Transcript_65389/m.212834 type:complete len:90 (-) Transcript_65389:164-433(-)
MNTAMAPGQLQAQVSPADMMIAEMKGMADCFARMTASCYGKCIVGVKEEKLSVGEMSCVDRCVNKYFDVHQRVATELQSQQATMSATSE